jgi:hypothetical protein
MENEMSEEKSAMDITVRELIDRAEQASDFVVHDEGGKPVLVVLPFHHFLELRNRAKQQGWWEMRETIAREIQLAMDLPDNPTIRDMIEFSQR